MSNTLRVHDDTSALTGDVVVAASATTERLHLSSLGHVFISGANDVGVAAALVQRALPPSRAATIDWYAVSGALHSVAPTRPTLAKAIGLHFPTSCTCSLRTRRGGCGQLSGETG